MRDMRDKFVEAILQECVSSQKRIPGQLINPRKEKAPPGVFGYAVKTFDSGIEKPNVDGFHPKKESIKTLFSRPRR
jgi:hypothetical protein